MHAPSLALPRPRALRAWAARHPLTAFTLLVFGIGWPIGAAVARTRHGHGPGGGVLLGRPAEEWLALALLPLVLLPAALAVTALADGRAGLRALMRRVLRWRIGAGWAMTVTLALPALALSLALLAGGRWREGAGPALLARYLWAVASAMVVINLAEELVWAGVVQTRLAQRHGLVVAALLTAIPFAGVHVPLLLMGSEPLLPQVAILLVAGAIVRLLYGLVLAGTGGSVLAVAVLHASFNAVNDARGVMPATLVGVDVSWQGVAAATILAAALGARAAARRRAAPAAIAAQP